jgi:four helix bundle protein
MALQSYRGLEVWQQAMQTVEEIYRQTSLLPKEELFGLISQMRRAATSIPANIAEGYGRLHRKEYLHHLSIARGSLMELETHLLICLRLNYLEREKIKPTWEAMQQTGKLLGGLIRSLSPDSIREDMEQYTVEPNP